MKHGSNFPTSINTERVEFEIWGSNGPFLRYRWVPFSSCTPSVKVQGRKWFEGPGREGAYLTLEHGRVFVMLVFHSVRIKMIQSFVFLKKLSILSLKQRTWKSIQNKRGWLDYEGLRYANRKTTSQQRCKAATQSHPQSADRVGFWHWDKVTAKRDRF